MPRNQTTNDLISDVRSLLDEDDLEALQDSRDILPAMNRAQKYAFDILSRQYPEPLIEYTEIALTAGTSEYDLPELIFEDKLLKVESKSSDIYYEVKRRSYRDISDLESANTSSILSYYVLYGKKVRYFPTPSSAITVRLWYLKEPDPLVLSLGRINTVSESSNYVVLDDVDSSITTDSSELTSYLNLIDGQTGVIKGTVQVKTIADQRVTFKSTPTRSTVLNRSVDSSLSGLSVAADDYVCHVKGTCIPNLVDPVSNFLVQYSVAELKRKLGDDSQLDQQVLLNFERQLKLQWSGRENSLRIKKNSGPWFKSNKRNWMKHFY